MDFLYKKLKKGQSQKKSPFPKNENRRISLWFVPRKCVSSHCNRTVFFVFVHIITVSVVSSQTQNTTCFFNGGLKTFLCQQLFKSSLTFLLIFIVIMLYFKCRLGDIKPYTIGRCRDLKPATMPTLVIRSAYFFIRIIRQQLSNKTFSQQYVMVQRFIKIFFLIMNIRCIQNHLQRISILYQQQNLIWKRRESEFVDFLYKN